MVADLRAFCRSSRATRNSSKYIGSSSLSGYLIPPLLRMRSESLSVKNLIFKVLADYLILPNKSLSFGAKVDIISLNEIESDYTNGITRYLLFIFS